MQSTQTARLVEETKLLIEAADSGEYERATWLAISDKLIAIKAAEPTWGNGRIGKTVGKSATWVADIVQWRTNPQGPSPWSEDSKRRPRDDRGARKVLRDRPEAVADEIAQAAIAKAQVAEAIAKAVADDPEAVKTFAKAFAGTDAAEVVGGHDYQRRVDDTKRRRQERRATEDPDKRRQKEELEREWEQRDFASAVLKHTSHIRIDVIGILQLIRDYEGDVVGEEIENAKRYIRTAAERLGSAADALDELEVVDIDKLIGQLTDNA